MQFSDILGQDHIKSHLISTANSGRIPHAQLFVGPEGSGTLPMAIAYAQHILCNSTHNVESNEACNLKFKSFAHPDLHFAYPNVTTDLVKTNPKSTDFLTDWRTFLKKNCYGGITEWNEILGVQNKQGIIRVEDAIEIWKSMSLKSYEGGYKVMIIWMAEKMNRECANKILKLLEEPTDKSLFILIAQDEEALLSTIKSRCQALYFNGLSSRCIEKALIEKHDLDSKLAAKIAHQSQGNFNKSMYLMQTESETDFFEKCYVDWVRAAFRAKGNASAIQELISWSEQIAGLGRETQKHFLDFCINMFRQALLLHYEAPSLVYFDPTVEKFELKNLAPYVNGNNIHSIFDEISDAIYHIERNGNPKIILTDLSIKLTRLIHKK